MSKKQFTLEDVDNSPMLLYKYIRGSHCYGLDTPESDVDTAGVYFAPKEQVYGLGLDYLPQVNDAKNDNVRYELRKFMQLLCKSNPTILESLFIPDRCIIYEHPVITRIKQHREKFVTQLCFNAFGSYARSQIIKARGLHKMCVQPILHRLGPLDFCYTPYRQGSTKIENWLQRRFLKQEFCGLVNISNMDQYMGLFYDWGNHFAHLKEVENIDVAQLRHLYKTLDSTDREDSGFLGKQLHEATDVTLRDALEKRLRVAQLYNMVEFIRDFYHLDTEDTFCEWLHEQKPIGYKGMVGVDGLSNELRLSSVVEGEIPLCHLQFNKNAYQQHCRKYKEQEEWKKNRNEVRYTSNKGKTYDAKNISHCFRLLTMCCEIARGEGVKLDRSNIDREFLLKIKNHGFEYEEIMEKLDEKCKEMDEAIANTTIPKDIDIDFVNDLTIGLYKELYGD